MRRSLAPMLALPIAGCAMLAGLPPRIPACAGALVPTQQLGSDFVARERFSLTHADRSVHLDLVLQKRDNVLVLIGFDPLGAKLFTVVQRGSETEVDAAPAAILAVPPLNVLRDVHRARFNAPTDAEVTTSAGETRIRNPCCQSETRLSRVSEKGLL